MSSITAPKELLPIFAALATGEPVEIEFRERALLAGEETSWTPKSLSIRGDIRFLPSLYDYRIKSKLVEVTLCVIQITYADGSVGFTVRSPEGAQKLEKLSSRKDHRHESKIIHTFTTMLPPEQVETYL